MRPFDYMRLYVLSGHVPVRVHYLAEWGRMFEMSGDRRRVALDVIEQPELDPVKVSTVFLGIDHNWHDDGPPLLFESLVFGGPLDGDMYRYSTWDEAAAGHKMLANEAVVEGKVAAWEVRQRLKTYAVGAAELRHALKAISVAQPTEE